LEDSSRGKIYFSHIFKVKNYFGWGPNLKKKLNFEGALQKLKHWGVELKIGSNFKGCIAKIEILRVKLKIDLNFEG
jgi:hypothetical protein